MDLKLSSASFIVFLYIRDLNVHFLLNLQSRTKFMKQCQEVKQNWIGRGKFDICFCVIFDQLYQSFISGKETGY